LHWHGVRILNAMDGVPGLTQAAIEPGATFDYRFTIPDAGTFWYRPAVTATGQRMSGPHGTLIVAERTPVDADQDVLLFLDALPAANEALRTLRVRTNERLRLRLVNAIPGTLIAVRVGRHRAVVMAMDGQPAEPFVARDSQVILGPGSRADLFVDATLEPGAEAAITFGWEVGERTLARLMYENGAPARPSPRAAPRPLPASPLPERMDFRSALRAEIAVGDVAPRPGPLFSARRGRTVMLALANRSGTAFAAHLHGHSCRLLDKLDDGWKPFWLDTLILPPQETVRVAFVADNPGKWLLETSRIGPSDSTSTTWFEVT
jgi:FtsP/CotA-like multicopper oxidase with cupredoxin domain